MSERDIQPSIAKIIANPENDELRLEFAEHCKKQDPARFELISKQIERATTRRGREASTKITPREEKIIEANSSRWSPELKKLTKHYEYDRGFPTFISIDPLTFLKEGERLLSRHPIRHIRFDYSTRTLESLPALLSSPLLSCFDSINLSHCNITNRDIEDISYNSNLSRCLHLDLSLCSLDFASFRQIATSPILRRLVHIERFGGVLDTSYHPGQRFQVGPPEMDDPWRATPWIWAPLGEDGVALEREFGYIPWLHPQDNACDKFDARWFVNQGILPKRPFGSPVEH